MRPNAPAHGVRHQLRRRFIAMLMILGLAVGMTVTAGSGLASAGTGLRYQVIDADNAHDGGVFYRNSPSWNDTARINGAGGYYGETVELVCGAWGDGVGPYANRRWHLVDNLSRPAAGRGWLPDRYLNTPNNANQATPGEPECGAAPAPTPSVSLAQGPAAPAGYRYAITLSSFPASSIISVSCRDSVTPGGFYNFSMVTDGAGNASTQNQCYSGDGPDHWVVANGVESNHVSWGAGSGGGGGTTPPPGGGGGGTPPPRGGGGGSTITLPKSVYFSGIPDANGGTGQQVADVNYSSKQLNPDPSCSMKSSVVIPPGTNTIAGWSRGRLGVIYALKALKAATPAQYREIHQLIFIDPGNSSDFVPCDSGADVNKLLADWLRADGRNNLLVLTGLRSEEKAFLGLPIHKFGKATFTGLWKYYFAGIWNQSFADRALVCDYNNADHAQIMKDSWGIVKFPPSGCPILSHESLPVSWHP